MNQLIQRITSAFGDMKETAMENGDKRGREPFTGAKTLSWGRSFKETTLYLLM